MATRVSKTGASGGHEFTQGSQPLHISELDADLDALFDNGITDGNVAPGAGIATSKLASDQGIIAGMLSSNAVTTPKIMDLNVTTAKLADQPNGVSTAKLNIGVTVNANGGGFYPSNFSTSGTSETTFFTSGPVVTRGGLLLIFGTLCGHVLISGGATGVTVRLRRAGTTSGLVQTWTFDYGQNGTYGVAFPVLATHSPGAGTFTFAVSVQCSVGSSNFLSDFTNPGSLAIIELA